MKLKYLTNIDEVKQISEPERNRLRNVTRKYGFYTNEYYLSLIDWSDPKDPIRRLIFPDTRELEVWGSLDASNEEGYTVIPGLQHKYPATALILLSNVCGGLCRYCFRKRIFLKKGEEILKDLPAALDYIKKDKNINNVLLTGGDPLILSTNKLENVISSLRKIKHVQIIRIGSKLPAFNPHRIVDDQALLEMFKKYSTPEKRIYVMTHFTHPRELTDTAVKAVDLMYRSGVVLCNQTPIIKGVNDNSNTLAELFNKLSFMGVAPYYLFQCRPAVGNRTYAVPIEKGYKIFERAVAMVSGLAKRVRFVMSHETGKIQIIGLTDDHVYLKYFRAANFEDNGRILVLERNPFAYWLDDYSDPIDSYGLSFFRENSNTESEYINN